MKNAEISAFLTERIEAEDFPSAVYLVAEKGAVRFADALGNAVKVPHQVSASLDTIYDLASLTKPLITALLCAKLLEKREINLEEKVSKFFAEFETSDKREITLGGLLSHTSGFPAWQPFYLLVDEPSRILTAIGEQQLETAPNARVRYSDFNFITLGFLLEKLYGKSLDKIAEAEILKPLGLKRTFFNPPENQREEIAATELGNGYEKQVCLEMNFSYEQLRTANFRNSLIWGEVHDGNAYFMNGVSGHAGLFGSVEDVLKIALQFLPNSTNLLKPETCQLFRTNFAEELNEARSIGFDLAATKDSTASASLASDSFGHLGFTGTSLWLNPERERVFILLTNRTHRPLPFVNINSTRRKFHELAADLLNKI
jgi:serine-type D-Ala-D-Ala carboxypeptidase